ncbi:MAG: PIN domain-containing protein [Desulfobacterales bacterium]|nr:PIN domain-containing protein [Desulfobacterales bacterium]
MFRVAAVDEKVIDLSLASDFKDFEDAVQCYSAVNAKVDCLITRNKADYVTDILPILTPEEFLVAICCIIRCSG